ncbi:MAG: plasmid recombination protein [Deltaproteobacteria bacterium]|jgi:hypothetical protein|nr:plasmid recombination protein [Deltaproteobacteria bacterium]
MTEIASWETLGLALGHNYRLYEPDNASVPRFDDDGDAWVSPLIGTPEGVKAKFLAENPGAREAGRVGKPFFSLILEPSKGIVGHGGGHGADDMGLNATYDVARVESFVAFSMAWAKSVLGGDIISGVLHSDEEKPHLHLISAGAVERGAKDGAVIYDGPRTETALRRSYCEFMEALGGAEVDFLAQAAWEEGPDRRGGFYGRVNKAEALISEALRSPMPPPVALRSREAFDREFDPGMGVTDFLGRIDEEVYRGLDGLTERFQREAQNFLEAERYHDTLTDMINGDSEAPGHAATHPLFFLVNLFGLGPGAIKLDEPRWRARLPDGRTIQGNEHLWEDRAARVKGLGLNELAGHLMGLPPDRADLAMGCLPPGPYGGSLRKVFSLRDYAAAPLPPAPRPDHDRWEPILPGLAKETGLSRGALELFRRNGAFYPDASGRLIFPCLRGEGYLAWDPKAQAAPRRRGREKEDDLLHLWYFGEGGERFYRGTHAMEGPGRIVFHTASPLDALVIKAFFPGETVVANRDEALDGDLARLLRGKYLFACDDTALARRLIQGLKVGDRSPHADAAERSFVALVSLREKTTWREALRKACHGLREDLLTPGKIPDGDLADALLVEMTGQDTRQHLDTAGLVPKRGKKAAAAGTWDAWPPSVPIVAPGELFAEEPSPAELPAVMPVLPVPLIRPAEAGAPRPKLKPRPF